MENNLITLLINEYYNLISSYNETTEHNSLLIFDSLYTFLCNHNISIANMKNLLLQLYQIIYDQYFESHILSLIENLDNYNVSRLRLNPFSHLITILQNDINPVLLFNHQNIVLTPVSTPDEIPVSTPVETPDNTENANPVLLFDQQNTNETPIQTPAGTDDDNPILLYEQSPSTEQVIRRHHVRFNRNGQLLTIDLTRPINQFFTFMNVTQRNPLNNLEDVKVILNDNQFDNLTTIDINNIDVNDRLCMICSDQFNDHDNIIDLSCNHKFHNTCIKRWLCEFSCKCPICRADQRENKKIEG